MFLDSVRPRRSVALLRLLFLSFLAAAGVHVGWTYGVPSCSINTKICGQGNPISRVLSGKFVQRDQQPWMVFLSLNFTTMITSCSAVILTEIHMLTAASCVYRNGTYPASIKAYYMSTERLKGDYLYVDQVRLHTDFNATNHRNDIALLAVQRPLVYSRYTKPICIPSSPMNLTGMRLTVAGWGRLGNDEPTGKKSRALEPVEGGEREQTSLYRGTVLGMYGEDCYHQFKNFGYDDLIMFCAERDSSALCDGDAAAPAMSTSSDGVTYLIGLASYGFPCGSSSLPSVFVRIDSFSPWIFQKLNRFSEYTEIHTS